MHSPTTSPYNILVHVLRLYSRRDQVSYRTMANHLKLFQVLCPEPALIFREREGEKKRKKRRKNEKKEKETRSSRCISRDREFTGGELHLRAWTFLRRIENANFRQSQFQRIREANTISVRPSWRKIGRRLVNDARKATKGIGASGRYWPAVRW